MLEPKYSIQAKLLSTTAEKLTAGFSILNTLITYKNFKANAAGHLATTNAITKTGSEITKRQNIQTSVLAKQLDVQNKIQHIDALQLDVSKSQLQSSRNIEQNQKISIEIQRQQTLLMQKQVLLNEQQLLIQQLSLETQEIQTKIMLNKDALRRRQKELKDTIYSFDTLLKEVQNKDKGLIKYLMVEQLRNDLSEYKVDPNELENIQDKQYSSQVLKSFEEVVETAKNELTEKDIQDLELLKNHKIWEETLRQEINEANDKIQKLNIEEKRISNIVEYELRNNNYNNKLIEYLQHQNIILKDKPNININSFTVLLIISFLLTLVTFNVMIFFKDNDIVEEISVVISIVLFLSFILFLSLIITILIKHYKNPSQKVKRNKRKIIIAENSIRRYESNKTRFVQNDNNIKLEKSRITTEVNEKENIMKDLTTDVKDLFNRYPDLLNHQK